MKRNNPGELRHAPLAREERKSSSRDAIREIVRRAILGGLFAFAILLFGSGFLVRAGNRGTNKAAVSSGEKIVFVLGSAPAGGEYLIGGSDAVVRVIADPRTLTQVGIMNADGSNVKNLRIRGNDPVLSPDGNHIAFVSSQKTKFAQIYLMDADGTDVKVLTQFDGSNTAQPAWSPDGRRIAFTVFRDRMPDRNAELWLMNPDGSNLEKLAEHASEPSWSPDGQRIAFVTIRDGNFQIYSMKSDGTDIRRLTHDKSEDSEPAWAPDGASIAFISNRDGHHAIFLMASGGGDEHRLAYSKNQEFCSPSWSPDGQQLAFTAVTLTTAQVHIVGSERPQCEWMSGDDQIFSMQADGSTRPLTGLKIRGFRPSFAPANH